MKTALLPSATERTLAPADPHKPKVNIKTRGERIALLVPRPDGSFGMRQPRTAEEKSMASIQQRILAALSSPDFWNTARALPGNAKGLRKLGRPTDHPTWVYLMMASIATVTGSQGSARAFVQDPYMWPFLQAFIEKYRPADFHPMGKKTPNRNHTNYFLKKWASDDWSEHRENARKAFTDAALTSAKQQGFLMAGELDFNSPDISKFVDYDATVFTSISKGRPDSLKDGKQCRFDPASGWHLKGGDMRVWGNKVTFASVRHGDFQSRIILDFVQVVGPTNTGVGDEAATIVESARRLKIQADGISGVIVDSILRGVHIEDLASNGMITINYPQAQSNPEGTRKNATRREKSAKIKEASHTLPGGRVCNHPIFVYGTVYHQPGLNSDGKEVLAEDSVEVVGYKKVLNKSDDTYRYYHRLKIKCRHGDFQTTIPLHRKHTAKERSDRNFLNLGELLRFYPTNTARYTILYGRRNDTECLHNQAKRTMPKIPALGTDHQSLFILGYCITHNALSRNHALRRAGHNNVLDGSA